MIKYRADVTKKQVFVHNVTVLSHNGRPQFYQYILGDKQGWSAVSNDWFDTFNEARDCIIDWWKRRYTTSKIKMETALEAIIDASKIPLPVLPIKLVPCSWSGEECEYYTDVKDCNGDIALTHCTHKNNPRDSEGNCTKELCPITT